MSDQPVEPTAPPPAPAPVPVAAENPGRTLGIVGFVLSFFTALIGLIISIVALRQSKKAGFSNGFALAGVVIGAIGTLVAVVVIVVSAIAVGRVAQACSELGPGTHQVGGTTYRCG